MQNRFAVLSIGIAALCLISFAGTAHAQNPEKFERVVPAKPQVRPAAPAKPVAPATPAPTSPAPVALEKQPLVLELMRKAQARESENGFCVGTDWPTISSEQEYYVQMNRALAGSAYAYNYAGSPARCEFTRTVAVDNNDGRRCVRRLLWICDMGGACAYRAAYHCRDSRGAYRNP